jgi:hypothetical protein
MADKSLTMFERMQNINHLYEFGLSEFKDERNFDRDDLLKSYMADKSLTLFQRLQMINELYDFRLSEFKIKEKKKIDLGSHPINDI